MTAIGRDEVMDELEAECSCAREVLAAMQAQRDQARDCAVALEQENAILEWLLAEARYIAAPDSWLIVPWDDYSNPSQALLDQLADSYGIPREPMPDPEHWQDAP